jgi:NTE family protein
VDYVAGTSIGALVGAALASGSIDALERVVRELDWKRAMSLLDLGLPRSGLLDGKKISASLRERIDLGDMEALSIPFCAVATDLVNGHEVRIDKGDLVEAIRASISIAGVFTPVSRGDMLLVDGGILNPVPAGVARDMGASYVIAVDVHQGPAGMGRPEEESAASADGNDTDEGRDAGQETDPDALGLRERFESLTERLASSGLPGFSQVNQWLARERGPNIIEVVLTAIDIMETRIAETQLAKDPPDLIIRPELGGIRPVDFHKGEEAIELGYRAATEALRDADVGR